MRTVYNRLLFLLAVLSALPSFGYAQVRESPILTEGTLPRRHTVTATRDMLTLSVASKTNEPVDAAVNAESVKAPTY